MSATTPEKAARPRLRTAVFISGGGTNFQALIDGVEQGAIPADLVLCISSNPTAGGLERAKRHGIATYVLPRLSPDEEATLLLSVLAENAVSFIALAGYMRMVPPALCTAYKDRIINIHPALLPAFGGKGMYGHHVHEAVLAYGARWSGATVHLVDEQYDHGAIVLQMPVPVHQEDTAETLAARVLNTEHLIYPLALRLFAEYRVRVDGRIVRINTAGMTLDPAFSFLQHDPGKEPTHS